MLSIKSEGEHVSVSVKGNTLELMSEITALAKELIVTFVENDMPSELAFGLTEAAFKMAKLSAKAEIDKKKEEDDDDDDEPDIFRMMGFPIDKIEDFFK